MALPDLAAIRAGFLADGLPEPVVDELLDTYVETKRRYYLGDHRPQAVEGGRFSEAAFRILQYSTTGTHTPLGRTLPKVPVLLQQLEQSPRASTLDDSLRLHIPRTLRLVYDIRNQRDAAHLADNIDPNLQDATLIVNAMDWVMAELVRLHHDVSANQAHAIIGDLVTREVPAIQEISGQPVVLRELQPRDQALLLLYREGTDRGGDVGRDSGVATRPPQGQSEAAAAAPR